MRSGCVGLKEVGETERAYPRTARRSVEMKLANRFETPLARIFLWR